MVVLQIVYQFFDILEVESNFPPLECGLDLVTASNQWNEEEVVCDFGD